MSGPVRSLRAAMVLVLLAIAPAFAGPGGGQAIALNFPANVQLRIVIEYVAARLGLNILYDERVASQSLNMTFKGEVTEGDLLPVLRTVLQFRDLSLVPAETKNVWKIVELKEVGRAVTRLSTEPPAAEDGQALVTQVVGLRRLQAERARQLIQPFLSSAQTNSVVVQERNLLLVTDYASNVKRATDLLALLEREEVGQEFRIYPMKHQDASAFAKRLAQMFAQREPTLDLGPPGVPGTKVTITPDVPSASLLIAGPRAGVEAALQLAEQFDTEERFTAAIRTLSYVEAARAEKLVGQLFQSDLARIESSGQKAVTVDAEGNALVLRGDEGFHQRVGRFLEALDVPPPPAERSGRVLAFKLYNTKVSEVFATLQAILSQGMAPASAPGPAAAAPPKASGEPASAAPPSERVFVLPPPSRFGRSLQEPLPGGVLHYAGDGIRLVGSEQTNSVLVSGTPERVQEVGSILRMLDRRRPQVLIELTLIAIDGSESLNLGTELVTRSEDFSTALKFGAEAKATGEGLEAAAAGKATGLENLVFTSFGLSQIDPVTGMLTPAVSPGLNAVIIRPGDVAAVIKALETRARARIVTAPRILVNDNAAGILESLQEQPYTTFYATQEVATTTFAGFAEAGTRLEVRPTISEGDHLQLAFTISVGNFSGESPGTGVPPPRSTKTLTSVVTVPDGCTVIVGGLRDEDERRGASGVPWLSRIPLFGYLVKTESRNRAARTVYAFIRPVILRDDRFEDLKYLSADDLAATGLPRDLPVGEPQWMDTIER